MVLSALLISIATSFGDVKEKANNANALNLGTSWTGGVVPGLNDYALWTNNLTANRNAAIGASMTWYGIIANCVTGSHTIGSTAGSSLTLGAGGIDLTGSLLPKGMSFVLSASNIVSADQTWNVKGGITFLAYDVSGNGVITKEGAGYMAHMSGMLRNGGIIINDGTVRTAQAVGKFDLLGTTNITIGVNGNLRLAIANAIADTEIIRIDGVYDVTVSRFTDTNGGIWGSGIISNFQAASTRMGLAGPLDGRNDFSGTILRPLGYKGGTIIACGTVSIGTNIFSGSNDYNGLLHLSNGVVMLGHPYGLGGAVVSNMYLNGLQFADTYSNYYINWLFGSSNLTLNDTSGNGINLSIGSFIDYQSFTNIYQATLDGNGGIILDGWHLDTPSELIFTNKQIYSGTTCINNGTLRLDLPSGAIANSQKIIINCTGNLIVAYTNNSAFTNTTELWIYNGGNLYLTNTIIMDIGSLYINGYKAPCGTWGVEGQRVDHKLSTNYLSGGGTLRVFGNGTEIPIEKNFLTEPNLLNYNPNIRYTPLNWVNDPYSWKIVTTNPSFNTASRYDHVGIAYNNKMWIMGGNQTNDVYNSVDGTNWTQVTLSAGWSKRSGERICEYSNEMWIIGGTISAPAWGTTNDVWFSTDGTNWTGVTRIAPWVNRTGHAILVYNDLMWIMGGSTTAFGSATCTNDVWFSADGTNWTQSTAHASWSARVSMGASVFNGAMWIYGGVGNDSIYPNDSWYSVDGTNWTQGASSGVTGKLFACYVYNGRIYKQGGMTATDYLGTLQSTADGTNWTTDGLYSDLGLRFQQACIQFNNTVYTIGGLKLVNGSSVQYKEIFVLRLTPQ
jgi:hypothetical protein